MRRLRLPAELSKCFYRKHLIDRKEGNYEAAFISMLHGVWVCDDCIGYDENAAEGARICRNIAVKLLDKILAETTNDNYLLVKADLLRRSGQFERLLSEYKDIRFENEMYNKILAFQMSKAV